MKRRRANNGPVREGWDQGKVYTHLKRKKKKKYTRIVS
jgi:hypothetical protein